MKWLRYSLLLPLIHLAISVPVIYYGEVSHWRHIPKIQATEDLEGTARRQARPASQVMWMPCYEYRPGIADRLVFIVEFPTGLLIAPHGSSNDVCNPALLKPTVQKVTRWMRVKTRIILLDCLLILGIVGQWGLVGRWLDRQPRWNTKRWIIPVGAIAISGIVMAPACFGNVEFLTRVAWIFSLVAFLGWLALLLMFAAAAVQWTFRLNWKSRSEHS